MDFDTKLKNYAELIVRHGLNVQQGQLVILNMDAVHRDLGLLISEQCYQVGARHVSLKLSDDRFGRQRIDLAAPESLEYVPTEISASYTEILKEGGANLKIVGSEFPDIFESADPTRVNVVRKARYGALKEFYEEGIGKSKVHWTVAAAATEEWGKKVFPNVSAKDACAALWEEIFKICRVDRPDYLAAWREHNVVLQSRARELSAKKIAFLRFKGPGTDLQVGLSEKAIFKGGGDLGPKGVEFEPNIPTEEVFSTPDWRLTEGTVAATRPVVINGVLIRDLKLVFENGKITSFSAASGAETFETYINSDEGAARLGEVALVGSDSPIFQSGLVFQEILFDENAACHIAIGSAYKFCIQDNENLSAKDFENLGCNESSVHTDLMISSEEVDVFAESFDGAVWQLIDKGAWV